MIGVLKMKICEISVDIQGKYYKINVSHVKEVFLQNNYQVICRGELYSVLNKIEPESFKSYYLSFLCGSQEYEFEKLVKKMISALSKRIAVDINFNEIHYLY